MPSDPLSWLIVAAWAAVMAYAVAVAWWDSRREKQGRGFAVVAHLAEDSDPR